MAWAHTTDGTEVPVLASAVRLVLRLRKMDNRSTLSTLEHVGRSRDSVPFDASAQQLTLSWFHACTLSAEVNLSPLTVPMRTEVPLPPLPVVR